MCPLVCLHVIQSVCGEAFRAERCGQHWLRRSATELSHAEQPAPCHAAWLLCGIDCLSGCGLNWNILRGLDRRPGEWAPAVGSSGKRHTGREVFSLTALWLSRITDLTDLPYFCCPWPLLAAAGARQDVPGSEAEQAPGIYKRISQPTSAAGPVESCHRRLPSGRLPSGPEL